MRKLRTETRKLSSYNPKSDEPSASQAQGVPSVVDQRDECFSQPPDVAASENFVPTAILDVCAPACWRSNHAIPELPS